MCKISPWPLAVASCNTQEPKKMSLPLNKELGDPVDFLNCCSNPLTMFTLIMHWCMELASGGCNAREPKVVNLPFD